MIVTQLHHTALLLISFLLQNDMGCFIPYLTTDAGKQECVCLLASGEFGVVCVPGYLIDFLFQLSPTQKTLKLVKK